MRDPLTAGEASRFIDACWCRPCFPVPYMQAYRQSLKILTRCAHPVRPVCAGMWLRRMQSHFLVSARETAVLHKAESDAWKLCRHYCSNVIDTWNQARHISLHHSFTSCNQWPKYLYRRTKRKFDALSHRCAAQVLYNKLCFQPFGKGKKMRQP